VLDCDFAIVTAKVHPTIDVCCYVPNGFQMAILSNKCTVLCSMFTHTHTYIIFSYLIPIALIIYYYII